MGVGIAYLPTYYENEKIIPAGSPFILSSEGERQELVADESTPISLNVVSTTKKKLEVSTDGVAKTFLSPGVEYTLHYWNNGWQDFSTISAGEEPLKFSNVPAGGLYWLTAKDSDREERIFTYDGNSQIWW
jgi:hypothetical protein